jgi:hypothetical protein
LGVAPGTDEALSRVVERVRELRASYEPPGFGHIPDPNAALFLCAVDHKSGYEGSYVVDGEGPLRGSALMWAVGLHHARLHPGWLTAPALARITGDEVAEAFEIEGETVVDPDRRAELWRELAAGLIRDHVGSARALLDAARSRLGGPAGLLARLARYDAFSDPLAKKAQLYAKICERRDWFEVEDPESWAVSADSVLMRLALRSGLVAEGEVERVRAATRAAFARVAEETAIPPPVLDDMLWELGRQDPDLLGREAGDLFEPPRDPASAWY